MNDSGMSDSQFMRFQKKTKERLQSYIDNYDKDIKIRQISERWESAKTRKKTLWERFVQWLKSR
jgi:hypothetical protein